MRSSAVKLLMRRRVQRGEAHHRQKLAKELRAEVPPCMPEKILRRRRQTTDRCAFQIRMEFVDDGSHEEEDANLDEIAEGEDVAVGPQIQLEKILGVEDQKAVENAQTIDLLPGGRRLLQRPSDGAQR